MDSAQSSDLDTTDIKITDSVRRVAREYDDALMNALEELVEKYPPKEGGAEDLWDARGSYLVLMTLRGEGTGIGDGDWDVFYDSEQLRSGGDIYTFLKTKLGHFADYTGTGSLNEAFMNAAHGPENGENGGHAPLWFKTEL